MPTHRVSASDNIRDVIGDDERVTGVQSVPGGVRVETEPWKEYRQRDDEDYSDMSRSELYDYAQEHGIDVDWAGDDADSTEEMRQKIRQSDEGDE